MPDIRFDQGDTGTVNRSRSGLTLGLAVDIVALSLTGVPVFGLLGASDSAEISLPGAGGPFQPFEFDATQAVRFHRPNYVAVKVTNTFLDEIGTGGIVAPVMFWTPRQP